MDKYEFKLKVDEMKALVSARNYNAAAEIAETINWRKIRNLNALVLAGEVFEQVERYEESKEILLLAYDKSPIGRNIIYRLAEIAIKTKNFEEAQEYYDEFVDIAPHDNLKFVLKYKMTAASGLPYKEQIHILEELKEQEYSEEWAYELAYLYHRDQQPEKCVEACDELILWFGDGIYVEKALELKMHYQALTKPQEEKYRMFRQKRTGVIEVKPNDFLESGEIVNEPVQIPSVEMNAARYNTANLQQEIARGMQQIANATGKEGLSDGINSIQRLVEDMPYQSGYPADSQSQAIGQFTDSMRQILQGDHQQSYQENQYSINSQILQDDAYGQNMTGRQNYDGQSQFILQDQYGQGNQSQMSQRQREPVPLVNQMSIEEILAEWEKTKQATQEALQEPEGQSLENVKERVLLDAEKLMEQLMSIVPQLTSDASARQLDISEGKPEEVQSGLEEAGRIVAGMNKLLQEQIDSLTAQQSDEQAPVHQVSDPTREMPKLPDYLTKGNESGLSAAQMENHDYERNGKNTSDMDETIGIQKLKSQLIKGGESGTAQEGQTAGQAEQNLSVPDQTAGQAEQNLSVPDQTAGQTEQNLSALDQTAGQTEQNQPVPVKKVNPEALQKFEAAKRAMMDAMKELQAENADTDLFDQEFFEKYAGINLTPNPQVQQPEDQKKENVVKLSAVEMYAKGASKGVSAASAAGNAKLSAVERYAAKTAGNSNPAKEAESDQAVQKAGRAASPDKAAADVKENEIQNELQDETQVEVRKEIQNEVKNNDKAAGIEQTNRMTAARTSVSGLQELSADQSEEQNADQRTVQENIEGNAGQKHKLEAADMSEQGYAAESRSKQADMTGVSNMPEQGYAAESRSKQTDVTGVSSMSVQNHTAEAMPDQTDTVESAVMLGQSNVTKAGNMPEQSCAAEEEAVSEKDYVTAAGAMAGQSDLSGAEAVPAQEHISKDGYMPAAGVMLKQSTISAAENAAEDAYNVQSEEELMPGNNYAFKSADMVRQDNLSEIKGSTGHGRQPEIEGGAERSYSSGTAGSTGFSSRHETENAPVQHQPEERTVQQAVPVKNNSVEEQIYPAGNPDVDLSQTYKAPESFHEQEQAHMTLASRPKFRTRAQIQAEESIGQRKEEHKSTNTEDIEEFSEEDMASAAQAAGFYQKPAQAEALNKTLIKHLTSEQRNIFSYFVLINGMEGQIYDLLKGVSDHLLFDKNSISGNIIVEGIQGSGKTVLIKNIIMCLQRQVKRPNGRIGKIDANALNQKDLDVLTEKISGGCLIIESAGKITRETAVKLSGCMERDHTGTLYILEDTKQGIQKALERDSSFAAKFTEKITIPLFTNDELVAFGRAYANDLDYDIDEMGVLALYKRINSIQKLDHVTTLTEVKEIVDEAIENAEKGVLKKVFGILTSTRSNDDNYVILREKDFEA